jgi:nucleotide-binding universal stress UspA family protein
MTAGSFDGNDRSLNPSTGGIVNPNDMNILVAVDDGRPAAWAADVAASFARRLGGRVTLVHVVIPPTPSVAEGVVLIQDDVIDRLKEQGRAMLDASARRLPKDVSVSTTLLVGAPAQAILAHAAQVGADLLVMGSRGAGRLSHFLLGSTAEAVIRECPCPVVTVSHDPSVAKAVATGPAGAVGHTPVPA